MKEARCSHCNAARMQNHVAVDFADLLDAIKQPLLLINGSVCDCRCIEFEQSSSCSWVYIRRGSVSFFLFWRMERLLLFKRMRIAFLLWNQFFFFVFYFYFWRVCVLLSYSWLWLAFSQVPDDCCFCCRCKIRCVKNCANKAANWGTSLETLVSMPQQRVALAAQSGAANGCCLLLK